MDVLIAVLALGVVLAAVLIFLRELKREKAWPFYAKKTMSAPEQVLYHRLTKALPECIVLAQVQASRILGVRKGHNFGQWNNRINRLSFDFVVCLKDSTVVAVIELDDSSHAVERRKRADAKKDLALKAAEIPLLRWSVKNMPDEATIQTAFKGPSQAKEAPI